MSRNVESGLRNYRVEFAREDSFGTVNDPELELYSTVVNSFAWEPDAVNEARRGLGSADPYTFLKGPESHEFVISYDMVKWFVDESGDPLDAAYDGIMRDSDNLLPNSHTIVTRQEVNGSLSPEATVNGSTGYGTRIYSVGRGGLVDEVEVSGDSSDAQPLQNELTYLVQKGRSYQIDQPDTETVLVVDSDNADDTADVTIEDEDGSTAETITLDGDNLVSTTESYGDIDAFELAEETEGIVSLYINEGDETSPTEGDKLAEISGSSSYNDVEGDLGVPAVDSGSREGSISSPEDQLFIGDRILRASEPYPYEIPSAVLSVANNVEETEVNSGYGMSLNEANREIELEATMFGENTSHAMLVRNLQNTLEQHTWEMTGGDLEFPETVLDAPGSREAEEGEAIMTIENTFIPTGINVN